MLFLSALENDLLKHGPMRGAMAMRLRGAMAWRWLQFGYTVTSRNLMEATGCISK